MRGPLTELVSPWRGNRYIGVDSARRQIHPCCEYVDCECGLLVMVKAIKLRVVVNDGHEYR